MISGHEAPHEALEHELAAFVGRPRALYFGSGYMANSGIVPALVGRGDAVFSDALNHACLIDGVRLSRAESHIYPHNDLAVLAQQLAASNAERKLVVTDAVFSMDGDIAPLREMLALCEQHDALAADRRRARLRRARARGPRHRGAPGPAIAAPDLHGHAGQGGRRVRCLRRR